MPAAGCFRDFVMREFDRFSGVERLSGGRRQSCSFKFRKAGIEHGLDAAKEFDEAFGASRAKARSQGKGSQEIWLDVAAATGTCGSAAVLGTEPPVRTWSGPDRRAACPTRDIAECKPASENQVKVARHTSDNILAGVSCEL